MVRTPRPPYPFEILVVCTGNMCRSPLTERLLQQGLETTSPGHFRVRSAGTNAPVGVPVTPDIEAISALLGVDLSDSRSRRLTAADIESADLILGLERSHRRYVATLVPRAVSSIFTLREFARIIATITPLPDVTPRHRWTAAVADARRRRLPAPGPASGDDVVDPYGRSYRVYQHMAHQITNATESLLQWERHSALGAGGANT